MPDHLRIVKCHLTTQYPRAEAQASILEESRLHKPNSNFDCVSQPSSDDSPTSGCGQRHSSASISEAGQFENVEDSEVSHHLLDADDVSKDPRHSPTFSPSHETLLSPRSRESLSPGSHTTVASSSSSDSSSRVSTGRGRASLLALLHKTTPPRPSSLAVLVPKQRSQSQNSEVGAENGHWRPIDLNKSHGQINKDRSFAIIP